MEIRVEKVVEISLESGHDYPYRSREQDVSFSGEACQLAAEQRFP
jgi:hypothetical protein